jgi:hypothetical protein
MTDTYLEASLLTFATIPSGSESAEQEVEMVNPANIGGAAVDSDFVFFGGCRVVLTATVGTLTVRAYDGDPSAGGAEIYRADYEYSAAPETLSDRLGADYVPCYDSIYITLEGSVAAMEATVATYIVQGALKPFIV